MAWAPPIMKRDRSRWRRSPDTSVTDANARFHFVDNAYVAGPALFPTVGSPNPMLTGVALARRLAEQFTVAPFHPDAGFDMLFDGIDTGKWRMSTIRNQTNNNPGGLSARGWRPGIGARQRLGHVLAYRPDTSGFRA